MRVSRSPIPRMRRRHPVRVEHVEVGELLAVGREQDRLAGDLADRQRRATAGVAVELGEHDAGEPDAVAERLGGGHRVLTDHRVDDEQGLVGPDGVADVRGLLHQLLVDAEPARGVDDDDVVLFSRACATPRRATSTGSPTPFPGSGAKVGDPGPLADDLQLGDRVGPLQVAGHQQRRVPLALEPVRELAGQRGLAGALQAGQHDHARRLLGQPDPPGLAAEDGDELLVDDLDDLLGRVQRTGYLGALGPLLDPRDEAADHRQRDVRLQQRDADLARGGVDVGVGEPPLAAQAGERVAEALGEGVEHPSKPTGATRRPGAPGTPYPASDPALRAKCLI